MWEAGGGGWCFKVFQWWLSLLWWTCGGFGGRLWMVVGRCLERTLWGFAGYLLEVFVRFARVTWKIILCF